MASLVLTDAQVNRNIRVLGAVRLGPADFTPFMCEFAHSNYERLVNFGAATRWTTNQQYVVELIDQRIQETATREAVPS